MLQSIWGAPYAPGLRLKQALVEVASLFNFFPSLGLLSCLLSSWEHPDHQPQVLTPLMYFPQEEENQ